jgi:hypothetical protein
MVKRENHISKIPISSDISLFIVLFLIFCLSYSVASDFRNEYMEEHEYYLLIYGIETWFAIRACWSFMIFIVGQRFKKKFLKDKEIQLQTGNYFKPKHIDVLQFAYGLPINKLIGCVSAMINAMVKHYEMTGCGFTLVILITKEGKKAMSDIDQIIKLVGRINTNGVEVFVKMQGREIIPDKDIEYYDAKRGAWVMGLDIISKSSKSRHFKAEETGLCAFDGDSEVPKEISKYFFRDLFAPLSLKKKIVATTIHNHAKVESKSIWTTAMFKFRFIRRSFIMMAIPNVLTGRGAAFIQTITRENGFKKILGSDLIDHKSYKKNPKLFEGNYLFFPFKLVYVYLGLIIDRLIFNTATGDDKSTLYYIFKRGFKIIYNPFLYVICHEDLPKKTEWLPNIWIFQLPNYSIRYCRNTLNNNPRLLSLGVKNLGILRYLMVLNDRFLFWTPMIGPLSLPFIMYLEGSNYFYVYISWIIFSRTIMTLMICYAVNEQWSSYYVPILYNDHLMPAFVKKWGLISPISFWTRQSSMKVKTSDLSLNILRYTTLLLLILLALGILSGAISIDKIFDFFNFGGKK